MTDQELDQKVEEILEAYGKELSKSRAAFCDAVLDKDELAPPIFYEFPAKNVRRHWSLRRIGILVAAIILIMAFAVASASGIREKMFNYFFDDQDGYTQVQPLEGRQLSEFELGYVPKGYEKVNEEDFLGIGYIVDYGNDKKQYMHFSVTKSEEYNASIDNDTLVRKAVMINDYQAYLFYDEYTTAVVWQIGDYTLDLFTELTEEELIKVAENITLKN